MANKSGIHIKAKNRGKFTVKAKKAGMSVQAFAKHVKAHPDKYSGSTRKQANFARNAKTKFKHQTGGQADLLNPDMFENPATPGQLDGINKLANNANQNPNSFVNTPTGQKMMSRYTKGANPYIKDFNVGATLATDIGNSITGKKLRQDEYLQTLQSMTPKFMQNTNQGGLNNIPAYTMLGGDDRSYPGMEFGGEFDHMMVGGEVGEYDYGHKSNEEYGREGIAHKAFYGTDWIYKAGGNVSSSKAKEILKDGTVHGRPLTDKQKRYFGWVAGGKKMFGGWGYTHSGGMQTGGSTSSPLDEYYRANATLGYYKDKLNAQLKTKNTKGYGDYFKGLVNARRNNPAGVEQYIQGSDYNDYLSPDQVKSTLGDQDYQKYINSLKQLNDYNVKQGKGPLYGNIEGNQGDDLTKLNYGRRFASLTTTPSFSLTRTHDNGAPPSNYSRNYTYNPKTGSVDFAETGDMSIRPSEFNPQPAPPTSNQPTSTAAVTSRMYGGKKYQTGGVQGKFTNAYHNTPYHEGQEVDLTTDQIKELKRQGYKIKSL